MQHGELQVMSYVLRRTNLMLSDRGLARLRGFVHRYIDTRLPDDSCGQSKLANTWGFFRVCSNITGFC